MDEPIAADVMAAAGLITEQSVAVQKAVNVLILDDRKSLAARFQCSKDCESWKCQWPVSSMKACNGHRNAPCHHRGYASTPDIHDHRFVPGDCSPNCGRVALLKGR